MEVLQVASELDQMITLYRERKPARVLEIGCWDGGTLREWLTKGAADAVVCAVDLEHRNSGAYDDWRKPKQTLHVHRGDSTHGDARTFMREHAPYDWAFIDGDHNIEYVRTDWNTVLPLMNDGGLVLLHDISPERYGPRVLFDELGDQFESWSFVDDNESPYSHGIGVVQV